MKVHGSIRGSTGVCGETDHVSICGSGSTDTMVWKVVFKYDKNQQKYSVWISVPVKSFYT